MTDFIMGDADPSITADQAPKERTYIGTKIVKGERMSHFEFLTSQNKPIPEHENALGYKVTYEDGYVSWSPQWVFERCYREISHSERNLIQ